MNDENVNIMYLVYSEMIERSTTDTLASRPCHVLLVILYRANELVTDVQAVILVTISVNLLTESHKRICVILLNLFRN